MMPHDIITLYSAKAIEYLMAVGFLMLFIPFWRYVTGSAVAAPAHEGLAERLTHWFHVPANTFFHAGHAWARADGGELVTVGMDDFAQKLLGAPTKLDLPPIGARLVQGEPGWSIGGDHKSVDMLAPVGGIVVEVNQEALANPTSVNRDPYGRGWLLRLRAPRATAYLATLRANDVARRWMDTVCESMTTTLTPALGHVYQDGGVPVEGLARIVAGDNWDQVARRYLLTDTDANSGPGVPA